MIQCIVRLYIGLIYVVAFGADASAVDKVIPAAVVVDQIVKVDFPPEDAYLFVSFDQGIAMRVPAVMVPPRGNEAQERTGGDWLVGTRLRVPRGRSTVTFNIVLVGAEDNYAFVPSTTWDLTTKQTFAGSTDLLREHLLQRKQVLQSWNVQLETQEKSLKRLRADAEVIANVGRILEVREEIESVEMQTAGLQRDIESLKQKLEIVKSLPMPRSYARREHELTEQLKELALAAKRIERSELQRRARAEENIQRQLTAIETTRHEDIAQLRKELAILRRKREILEKRRGIQLNDTLYDEQRGRF